MKVILATDGTKFADAAADMIGKLALSDGDSVQVVCVVDMALPFGIDAYGGAMPDTGELEKAARENASEVVASAKNRLQTMFEGRSIKITGDIQFGSPAGRIVETAEAVGADLIVIGSHGYNQLKRFLLGSVSTSVVQHAHCSVMVVRSGA